MATINQRLSFKNKGEAETKQNLVVSERIKLKIDLGKNGKIRSVDWRLMGWRRKSDVLGKQGFNIHRSGQSRGLAL